MTPAGFSVPGFTESVDRRVLGGFVFVDGITGNSITNPLPTTIPQFQLKVNRSGIYAILNGLGLDAFTTEFIPNAATWPAAQTVEMTVSDPSLRYLPRRAKIQAPQTLATVVTPQQVRLYPAPSSTVEANWAVVRVSVTDTNGNGLPYAVVQVLKSDNSVAATGMTDARGEGLLAVIGLVIQVSSTATDPVTDTTTPVTIKAFFNPANPSGSVTDPDDILGNLTSTSLKTGTQTGALSARETIFIQVTISV
jgi:hypothetical protein